MSRSFPYLDSKALINSVRKRCSLPENDALFSEEDILEFANDEMMDTVMPKIKSTQEEYFLANVYVPLEKDVDRYDIPERALANALRDISYVDGNGNEQEMTRIDRDNRYNNQISNDSSLRRFYVENNQIVLASNKVNGSGELKMTFLLRPNLLVTSDKVSKVQSFARGFVQVNSFEISGTQTLITTNNAHELSNGEIVEIANVSGANSNLLTGNFSVTVVNSASFLINVSIEDPNNLGNKLDVVNGGLVYNNTTDIRVNRIPQNFTTNVLYDILRTRSPHNFLNYDVRLLRVRNSSSTLNFKTVDISDKIVIGDTIAIQYETDIPGIPTELHRYLVSKVTERVMESMNDDEGYNKAVRKTQESEDGLKTMITNRVTSAPLKVTKKRGFLRRGNGTRRGF